MPAIDPVNGGTYYFEWDSVGGSTTYTVTFSGTTTMDIRAFDDFEPGDEFALLIDGNAVAWSTAGYEGGYFVGLLDDYLFAAGDHTITIVTSVGMSSGGAYVTFGDIVLMGPTAVADSAGTGENAAVVVDVLANDTPYAPGAVLTLSSASVESGQGTVTVHSGNEIRFDPGTSYDYLAAGETATVVLSYVVAEAGAGTATGTATVTVTGANDGPVAAADAFAADEGVASGNLWATLLGNDTDVDASDVLSITAVNTGGTLGSVTFNAATQTLVYNANTPYFDTLVPGTVVTDSFTYTITDSAGATSTATVTVTVTATFSGTVITLGEGNDDYTGTPGEDHINGAGGNDTLNGLGDDDLLQGGAGDDVLIGGAGRDRLEGGDGKDTASYRTATYGVRASLSNPATNTGDAAGDSYVGIEHLEGSAYNDILVGNAGANDFIGGHGYDTVSYAGALTGVVASLGHGTVGFGSSTTQTGEAAGDRYNSIEVLEGSNFDDVLFAAATGSTLVGRAGNDTLYGLGGNDTLVGEAGQDVLIGDGGTDWLYGGNDDDMLRGDAGGDYLYGQNGNDTLNGGAGNDLLDGGAGNDVYTGGTGADRFIIRDLGGIDTITDFKRAQGDQIDLSDLHITEWIGTQAFHNDAGEVRIRNVGSEWWLEGDTNGDSIADFSIALGTVKLLETDIILSAGLPA